MRSQRQEGRTLDAPGFIGSYSKHFSTSDYQSAGSRLQSIYRSCSLLLLSAIMSGCHEQTQDKYQGYGFNIPVFTVFLCVMACHLNNFKVTVSRGDETRKISHRQGRTTVCSKDIFDAMQITNIISPCGS